MSPTQTQTPPTALTPTVVDDITFTGMTAPADGTSSNPPRVEVLNLSGDFPLFVTVDGVIPAVNSQNAWTVPAGVGAGVVLAPPAVAIPVVVRVISAGAAVYTVSRVSGTL